MPANVYIDGFNLYYGCLRGTPYKWLDLVRLCRLLLPAEEIKRVRYFTARIKGRPDDPDGPARQDAYLRALAADPAVTVHLGHFLQSTVRLPLATPPPSGPRTAEVLKMEEKGSDVNLATYLLVDAFRADCDLAVVVTNDSDLEEPIRIVRNELGLRVGILNPHQKASRALLRTAPTFVKQIRRGALSSAQLPDEVRVGSAVVRKPAKW